MTPAREHVASQIAVRFGLTPAQLLDSMNILIGTIDQMVETLQNHRELRGTSCIEIPGDHMEQMAPVIERLAGR